jgi:hypothetical protein
MLGNLIQEAANNPGSAIDVTLLGPSAGRRSFGSKFSSGAVPFYGLHDGTQWEIGLGTYTAGPPAKLSRTTVLDNSQGNTARLNFVGAVTVYNDLPAERAVFIGSNGKIPPAVLPIFSTVADNAWAGAYDLGTSDTDFFGIPVPDGTHRILGTMSARGENQSALVATATIDVILRASATGAELQRSRGNTVSAGNNVPRFWQLGGPFSFVDDSAAGFVGCSLIFKARKDAAQGPFNIFNYNANVLLSPI